MTAAPAWAVRPSQAPDPADGKLEHADGKKARAFVQRSMQLPLGATAQWTRFVDELGPSWTGLWDDMTGVPSRLFGKGESVPGSVADGAIALAHARSMLERHISLLAPGAKASDFVLVTNLLDRDTRFVAFVQYKEGLRVLGGQVSFRYKKDRLFLIGSEALPHVQVAPEVVRIPHRSADQFAKAWMYGRTSAPLPRNAEGPFILPLMTEGGLSGYSRVYRVRVDSREPVGSWNVYVDASTGAPVARQQMLLFADATVQINTPVRWPGGARQNFAAQGIAVQINNVAAQTDSHGVVTVPDGSASLVTTTAGPLVKLDNRAGSESTEQFLLNGGGTVTWNESSDELIDAELTALVHAHVAKDFARTLNPTLAWLDQQIPVNVNIADSCNAFSDGNSINFFKESAECSNTARLPDVVYHEFGHSLHQNSIIEGVGAFDGAHSEGLSDFLASSITGDPGMGRGFFKNNGPLRHLDPPDREHRWPEDIGGVHFTGLIFAGAMWDLRTMLIEKYGATDGAALALRLYYATLRRATDIPSTYIEVLAENDDDADLTNGTPDVCDINTAFGLHGLRAIAAEITQPSREQVNPAGHDISIQLSGLYEQCPGDTVESATIKWFDREQSEATAQEVAMQLVDAPSRLYAGTVPEIKDGTTVQYQLTFNFTDGTSKTFPENPADPHFEFYVGDTVTLYCASFDENPFEKDWTHGLSGGSTGDGADDWAWGIPISPVAANDPISAFTGDHIIGNDLGGGNFNGTYQSDKKNFARGPVIEVGQYSDVHLQYFRWLTVEDGFFDQATILVNEQVAWQNYNSNQGNSSAIHHRDREWRFHDVPVSQYTKNHVVDFQFELESDSGLEFGGWNIDDVCLVALKSSICGDGVVTGAEECDDADANSDSAVDACRTSCFYSYCGDGIRDTAEECDDGNTADGDDCNRQCEVPNQGCGCHTTNPAEALGLAVLFALMAWGTRRRLAPVHMRKPRFRR